MLLLDFLMAHAVPALHWVACFVVMAEGLNKLERTPPLQRGQRPREYLVVLLKVAAWILLVLGAAGGVARPWVVVPIGGSFHFATVLIVDRVSLVDLLFAGGFALLIVRSRFKEHL
jgi:membrane-associated PAP2 superfamily phosphatase